MAKPKITEILLDFVEILITGTTVFVLVYLFVGQLLEVSGDSMLPTFHNKEQIIAEKISLAFKPLERGEIVIFRHPQNQDKLLIKRVVALPGDTVSFVDGRVILNGEEHYEKYLDPSIQTYGGEIMKDNLEYKVNENSYLLLGDNRKESADSRSFGAVKADLIVGRALVVYHPLKNFRVIEH